MSNLSKLGQLGTWVSHPCYVRNLPWKIKVESVRTEVNKIKYLSIYLECNAKNMSKDWSCHASVELKLLTNKTGIKTVCRKFSHLFHNTENDWGYEKFILWKDLLEPKNGYVENDSIRLEAHLIADAPHGVIWVTRREENQEDNVDKEKNKALKDLEDKMKEHNKFMKEEMDMIKELIMERNTRENNREKEALQQSKGEEDSPINETVKKDTSNNNKETGEVEEMKTCTEKEKVSEVRKEQEIIDLEPKLCNGVEIKEKTEKAVEEKNQKRNEIELGEGEVRIDGVWLEWIEKDKRWVVSKRESKKEEEDAERKIIEKKRLKRREELTREIEDRKKELEELGEG